MLTAFDGSAHIQAAVAAGASAFLSGALKATAQSPEARAAAGTVRRLSRDALEESRRMVGLLRLPGRREETSPRVPAWPAFRRSSPRRGPR